MSKFLERSPDSVEEPPLFFLIAKCPLPSSPCLELLLWILPNLSALGLFFVCFDLSNEDDLIPQFTGQF